jgi:uroporphyrinogen decarboxylase
MYRNIFKPRHRKIYQYIKDNSDLFIFLHSCGAIHPLIPDLIDVGVDIISPVQISARGMDPKALKKEFGRDVTFWGGGVDTQHTLPEGTPDEVRKQVRENIEAFAPGGGFVFNQVHNVQADVPPENIVAMFDEAQKAGRY